MFAGRERRWKSAACAGGAGGGLEIMRGKVLGREGVRPVCVCRGCIGVFLDVRAGCLQPLRKQTCSPRM